MEKSNQVSKHVILQCIVNFSQAYRRDPESIAFCPYRICPLGAHVDHQYGKITGLAIDKGIHIAYGPKQNGVVELMSLNFPKCAQFHVNAVPEKKENEGQTICEARRGRWGIGIHFAWGCAA